MYTACGYNNNNVVKAQLQLSLSESMQAVLMFGTSQMSH